MEAYAILAGEWSDFWGNYTWQRLNGGHRALADCHAVISRLVELAAQPDPE
ncbi:hypothetical protein QMK19_28990 [Streptomyces sp. H10-C2]|uniref:hypothetical protein n=1 Tax=Streptomyces TaxID=1883 RepID=UPI0018E0511B|nr:MULTISPECIES: hypothetical protein [Streptomyces]MDJ0344247.1 hypothetical protein [Streptomyces sp. PH10-H1]MDJ0373585.1 hypothetical protein [Streptomyces sp. H10-C2]